MPESLNFSFLVVHDTQLVRLGTLAERYFADDPNTCLIKLRQFGELLAQLAAAKIGLYEVPDERQIDLLNRLRDRGLVKGEVDRLFHELRKIGNVATHELSGNHRTALSGLKYARVLGIWFHRVFSGDVLGQDASHLRNFDPGPFIPPSDPKVETQALNQSILAKAFRGELISQEPDDEPASVLLERIRAEREKLNNSKPKSKRTSTRKRKTPEGQVSIPGLE